MRVTILVPSIALAFAIACSKAQTDSVALCNKGVMAYKRGDLLMAQGFFQRALELWPKNQVAHYQLGILFLHEKKDFEQAERHLNEALRLNPKDAEVIFHLGRLKLEKGQLDEALEHFNKTLQINPNHVGALYWSGIAEKRREHFSEADEFFRKAIMLDPEDGRPFNALAMLYWENGAESEAMAVLKEALRINPEDPESHHNLGLVYMGMGNYRAAVEEITTALQYDPDDPIAVFNLACALIRVGRYNEAGFYLRKFIVEGRKVAPYLIEPAEVIYDRIQRLISASRESR